MTSTIWNDDNIARLRSLWDEGHSTAEIGRRMGITKNAVVGKAHRLELPGRQSPIRRGGTARPRLPQREAVPLPALVTAAPAAPAPAATVAAAPARVPALPVQPAPARPLGSQPCCWPIGEPGTAGFRFCDDPAIRGKPYCPEHAGRSCAVPQGARTRTDRPRLDCTRGRLTAWV